MCTVLVNNSILNNQPGKTIMRFHNRHKTLCVKHSFEAGGVSGIARSDRVRIYLGV